MSRALWGVLVLGLCSSTGCAPKLAWRWSADEVLKAPPAGKYAHKRAVYLLKERRILSVSHWRSPSFMQVQEHDVLAILSEKGFKYANVRVPYRANANIVSFAARTIGPDGSVHSVEPANIHDDVALESEVEDENYKVRVFSFPEVKVGSVLEYQYMTEAPEIFASFREWTNSELPVEKYNLELQGTKDILYTVKAYNTTQNWQKSEDGDTWKLTWVMNDIPATVPASYAPDRRLRDPWWVFAVRQFNKYNVTVDMNTDWNATMRGVVDRAYYENDEYYAGFKPHVDDGACQDKTCRIGRALAWLTKELPFKGFDIYTSKKVKEVLAKGTAVSYEKTRILWWLLKEKGIDAKLAYLNRRLEGRDDRDFPYIYGFNHVILFVPKQEGLDRELWLDPSCEYCAVGQLPVWDAGGLEALVLFAEKPFGAKKPEVKSAWKKVEGQDAIAEMLRRKIEVKVEANGAIKTKMEYESIGRTAQDTRNDKHAWTDQDYRKNAEENAKERAPTATVDGYTQLVVDENVQRASRTIDFSAPGYATLDGDQLLVPIGFLSRDFEKVLKQKKRTLPIVINRPEHFVESALIDPPEGFTPAKLPEAQKSDSVCFETKISAASEGTKVRVTREIQAKLGSFPVAQYAACQSAVKTYTALRQAVVVFQKTAH